MYKFTSLAAALAISAQAGPHLNACPADYKPMAEFDVERYSGLWYE